MAQISAPTDAIFQRRRGFRGDTIKSRRSLARVGKTALAPAVFLALCLFVFSKVSAYFDDAFVGAILSAMILLTAMPLLIPSRRRPRGGGEAW
jgi:hypothetical protein